MWRNKYRTSVCRTVNERTASHGATGKLRMILQVLPTYYYLDHFTEMLSFVEETYRAALGPEHHGFKKKLRALAMDEQCLFVRMLNSRGYILPQAGYKYAEISDL